MLEEKIDKSYRIDQELQERLGYFDGEILYSCDLLF